MYEILFFVVPAITFGAGCLVRYKSIQIGFQKKLAGVKAEADKKLAGVKAEAESAKMLFEKKLAGLKLQIETIEQYPEFRRIAPTLHRATAMLKVFL